MITFLVLLVLFVLLPDAMLWLIGAALKLTFVLLIVVGLLFVMGMRL